MKKIITLFIILLISLFPYFESNAQNPTFNISAMNFVYTDSIFTNGYDALTFDIYIEHSNVGVTGPFEFGLGQYYFNINSAVGVTAEYNYFIVPGSTTFSNTNAVPRNPTFVSPDATAPTGASLRVNSNIVLGAGNGPIVSSVFPGTRVATFKFKKKSGSFPIVPFYMAFRTALPNPFTKVFAYVGTTNTDISSGGTYYVEANPPPSTFGPKVALNNPPNNSLNSPLTVSFNWKGVNCIKYFLQIYTDSLLNNMIINDTIDIDTFKTLSGFVLNSKYFWRVVGIGYLGGVYYTSVWSFSTPFELLLNLKAIPEGIYYNLFNQLSRIDTMTVYLRNSESPYSKVDSAKAVIDSVNFSGKFKFPNVPAGTYYIAIKHFNSIETWSKSGGVSMNLTDTAFYDFTTAASQAYGNNLKLKGSKYCTYSGDINQDGIIDATDLIKVYNDSYAGLTGRFLVSDMNGDSIVDASDISTADNNVYNGVMKITP